VNGIAVFGSEGRMGRLVREIAGPSVLASYDAVSPGLSAEVPLPPEVDVVIEFSLPCAWGGLDRLLTGSRAALVSGTTGLGPTEEALLRKWSSERAVFRESNMSVGIHVLGRLLRQAGRLLADRFDLEVVEVHHGGKLDSPSGTALDLVEIWEAEGGGGRRVSGRSGRTGPRKHRETGIHSLRGGDVAGEHQLHLLGSGERLLLAHSATGRVVFAEGALRAARFLAGRPPGLYGMNDLLGGGEG
jgi:4-hydroxy-tetrahydrodipicolinate reductase